MSDQDEFFRRQDERRTIRAKAERGERLTPDEAHEIFKAESLDELAGVFAEIDKETSPKRALVRAVTTVMAISTAQRIGQYRKRYELEDRVAALEPKRRIRVKAPSRPI